MAKSDLREDSISDVLQKTKTTSMGHSAFDSIIAEDQQRLAADNPDKWTPEAQPITSLDQQVADMAKQADVPYFSATDGLARDLATKIAQSEQRLREMAGDIESLTACRDRMVTLVQDGARATIATIEIETNKLIAEIDANHLQELAIIRGRETDEIKGLSTLRATIELLQRK